MLENLLNGKEQSKIVLIKDTIEQSGYPLATCYLKSLSNRFDQIHLLCFDISPQTFKNVLPEETLSQCTFHDFSSDPLGWLDDGQLSVKSTDVIHSLQKHPTLSNSSEGQQSAVMLCSLTNLIIQRSPSYTCRLLQKLVDPHSPPFAGITVGQVVSVVHNDLHGEHILSQLGYVASSVITLLNNSPSNTFMNCHILHHRTTGKILRVEEQFRLSSNYEMKDLMELRSAAVPLTDEDQLDPTANLTFKLNLTDKEKADRSRQVLPHIKIQSTPQEDETSNEGGGGQIFYEPDDADDFDEEDPDDDLDI